MKGKHFIALGIASMILAILCACAPKGNPLPQGMEEEAVLSAGREIVSLLNQGSYEEVSNRLRQDAGQGVSAEEIGNYMDAVLRKAGEYQRETGAMATGQTLDSGEAYATAVFSCRHQTKTAVYRIAFDQEMTLMGLEITTR